MFQSTHAFPSYCFGGTELLPHVKEDHVTEPEQTPTHWPGMIRSYAGLCVTLSGRVQCIVLLGDKRTDVFTHSSRGPLRVQIDERVVLWREEGSFRERDPGAECSVCG